MRIDGAYTGYVTEQTEISRNEQGNKVEKDTEQKELSHDEYISSEQSENEPIGLYRLEKDENGEKKIVFDDPNKKSEECTTNTDKVDREIEKLKEEKKQLEQKISAASGDDKKVAELKKRLEQIENELSQKDNDTYRRQNSTTS